MLNKVKDWNPPTNEHFGLKKFMMEQLQSSIDFDCNIDYYERANKELDKLTFEKWYNDRKNQLNRDLEYHTKENKEEIDRTNERNKWIIDLYKSLGLEIK